MAAQILEWAHLTGPEIDRIDRSRAVVMVTCSPLEVHGPHLPVITDNLEATGIGERTMEILAERHPEIVFLRLPPIYVAADVLPHVGSLMFRSSTIVRVLEDLGRSLAKQGFRNLWVASFHGGPRHFVPIEYAARRVNRRHGGRMVSCFSLLVNVLTGGQSELSSLLAGIGGIRKEDLVGDHHGGAIETSLMLHLLSERVDAGFRGLARSTVDGKLEREGRKPLGLTARPSIPELLRGFKEKLKYYETETYSGTPAVASAEAGAEYLEILARKSADALSQVWTGERSLEQCHSPLWPVRWIFLWPAVSWLFERAVAYRSRVF